MADKVIVSKSKLQTLGNAIRSKTGTTASLTLDAMANEISNIETGTSSVNVIKTLLDRRKEAKYLFNNYNGTSVDGLISYSDTENVTNMTYMFYGCVNLQTIPQLDTSNVTDMTYMFNKCNNLQTIPQLDTGNVTDMDNMFYGCTNLQTVPQLDTGNVTEMGSTFRDCVKITTIPQLNTSNVNTMSYMFYGCTNLQTVLQLNTSNVYNMSNMFRNCSSLQTIDITSMDKCTSTSNTNYMCNNCPSLTKLIIRTMEKVPSLNSNAFTNCYHFTGTVDATYNPNGLKDGRIYVPDNKVESLKSATNWSVYADIIVPLSTLVEG